MIFYRWENTGNLTTYNIINITTITRSTPLNSGMMFHLTPIPNIIPISPTILLTFRRNILSTTLHSKKRDLSFLKLMIEGWSTFRNLQAKCHQWKSLSLLTFQVFLKLHRFNTKSRLIASKPPAVEANKFIWKKRSFQHPHS